MSIQPLTVTGVSPIPPPTTASGSHAPEHHVEKSNGNTPQRIGAAFAAAATPRGNAAAEGVATQGVREAEYGNASPSALERRTVEEATRKVQKAVSALNSSLQFQIDDETEKLVIKIVDTNTQEVIKQIPPQVVLEIAKALDKLQGLLVREKA